MNKNTKKAIIGSIMIFIGFSMALIPKNIILNYLGVGLAILFVVILVFGGIYLTSDYLNNLSDPNNPWNKFKK